MIGISTDMFTDLILKWRDENKSELAKMNVNGFRSSVIDYSIKQVVHF